MAPALSKYFTVRVENELEYLCSLAECGRVIKVSKSNKSTNLGRHLQLYHPELDLLKSKNDTATYYEAMQRNLILSCVEMVTVNGRPLAALEDSGFRRLINPVLSELEAAGRKTTITASTIQPHIEMYTDKIREKISEELNGRLLSLMADVATKNNRGILGINTQYAEGGKIVLRTLGMCELKKRHTGEEMAKTIEENLSSYGVSMNQIHSFTSDNARSMLKSGRLLNHAAIEMQNAINREFDSDIEILSDSDVEIISDDDEDAAENIGQRVADILKQANPSLQYITGIGCAAHSLQTAIRDALKSSKEKPLIRKCREVVKTLRTLKVMLELKELGVETKPTLDVKTRWDSTYLMVSNISFS